MQRFRHTTRRSWLEQVVIEWKRLESIITKVLLLLILCSVGCVILRQPSTIDPLKMVFPCSTGRHYPFPLQSPIQPPSLYLQLLYNSLQLPHTQRSCLSYLARQCTTDYLQPPPFPHLPNTSPVPPSQPPLPDSKLLTKLQNHIPTKNDPRSHLTPLYQLLSKLQPIPSPFSCYYENPLARWGLENMQNCSVCSFALCWFLGFGCILGLVWLGFSLLLYQLRKPLNVECQKAG